MFFYKYWLFNRTNREFYLYDYSVIFCSDHFRVNIFCIFSTLHAVSLHLTFITLISKTLNYFLLLCFCFKNLDLFDQQTTKFDFSLSTLSVIFTSYGLKLCVKSLYPKQHVVLGLFPIFTGFISNCVFFIFCNLVKCFWQSILNTLIC